MGEDGVVCSDVDLKSVKDLVNLVNGDDKKYSFFIPSYQRGYRWDEQQVNDLLNDLNDFFNSEDVGNEGNSGSFYCLQPLVVKLVVKKDEVKKHYEVIDGQQRLTTFFILYNFLQSEKDKISKISKISLKYETRLQSSKFIEKLGSDTVNPKNIDFDYMKRAYDAIRKWFESKEKGSLEEDSFSKKFFEKFFEKLFEGDAVKFIWYEIGNNENAYDVFKRLNSGKISLSDAELVKALILNKNDKMNKNDKKGDKEFNQQEISLEWNEIEKNLQNDVFWYFINPDPDNPKYEATRIDFIIELCVRQLEEKYEDYCQITSHPNFVFTNKKYHEEGWKSIWELLKENYRIIKEWFENRETYHYIGYLMNRKGAGKIKKLVELLADYKNRDKVRSKSEFIKLLRKECADSIFGNGDRIELHEKSYPNDSVIIHNILLLFNLAATQNQISEMSRYPFDRHAVEKWSLEHIHAQNERKKNWTPDEIKKIKGYLEALVGVGLSNVEKEEVNKCVKTITSMQTCLDGRLPIDCRSVNGKARIFRIKLLSECINEKNIANNYNAVIGALMGEDVKIMEKEGEYVFSSDFEKDDSLKNMALLQGNRNSALNNKLYPEKREIIAGWEKATKETLFIPICTRNVFFKHYSPLSMNPLIWDEKAGEEYVSAMMEVVAKYIGVDYYTKKENEDRFEGYGLLRRKLNNGERDNIFRIN